MICALVGAILLTEPTVTTGSARVEKLATGLSVSPALLVARMR